MKRRIAACALLAACTGAPARQDVFTEACAPVTCGPATQVSTVGALVARMPQAWKIIGRYTTGCHDVSEDLAVSGSLTVTSSDIPAPAQPLCFGGPCAPTSFVLRNGLAGFPGVECLDPTPFFEFTACGGVRITDATVRLRTVQRDIHPAPGNFIPLVEVLRACDAGCTGNEFTCEEARTCWSTARDHCAYCLNGTNAECACWDGSDFKDDGAACDMFVSGDVQTSGTCQAGVCVTAQ